MNKLEVFLLTGRTIGQGQGKEHGKLSKKYFENVAVCQMDPEDMKRLKVKENSNVKITTKFGSIVVKVAKSMRKPHSGVVFIPYGPWANMVVNPETHGTGMPLLKGVKAWIEPTDEKVSSLPELLKKSFGK